MLLNWDRKRMNGPRFRPSGSRLGPNFCSRADASLAASPVSLLVASRSDTSTADIACQGTTSLAVFGFAVVLIGMLRRARPYLESATDSHQRSTGRTEPRAVSPARSSDDCGPSR